MSQAKFRKKTLEPRFSQVFFIHPYTCLLQNVHMEIHCVASFVTLPVDTDGYNIENSINSPNWKVEWGGGGGGAGETGLMKTENPPN